MSDELQLDSGTADMSGGVGNGQATGTGHVSDNFNMDSAVNAIGDSLGFGKSDATENKTTPPTEGTPTPPAEVKPVVPAAPIAPTPTDIAPKTWKAEEAADWATIPPSAKAAIARREEEMFKGIEQYKNTANFGTTVQNIMQPHMQMLQALNIAPLQNMQNLLQAQKTLTTGSMEQKTAAFHELAREFGVDLSGQTQQQQDAYTDPQVLQLRQELAQVRAGQSSLQEARYQEILAKTETDVNAFAAHPDNIHFNDVAEDMARMLNQDKSMTMQKAYENAVWSNPVTRAKEIEKQNNANAIKASEDAAKKAAEFKKATAANVRVQPKAGAATLPLGSMEDTMRATMASINNRSN